MNSLQYIQFLREGEVAEASADQNSAELKLSTVPLKMWAKSDDVYVPCSEVKETLPVGGYLIRYNRNTGQYMFNAKTVETDELIHFPDSDVDMVMQELRQFLTKEEQYKKFDVLWKRGILLYGPPGSGKSSCISLISSEIYKMGGITIFADIQPSMIADGIRILRKIEPDKPIVVVMEELESFFHEYNASEVLGLLDGDLQTDKIVFIATTNYPELLEKRVVDRPSRFDLVKKISAPNEDARRLYIKYKVPDIDEFTLQGLVDESKDFSIAHLKELILLIYVYDKTPEEAIARLRKMKENKLSSANDFNESQGFGFA